MHSVEKAIRWKIAELKKQTTIEVFDSFARDEIYDTLNGYEKRVKLLETCLNSRKGNYSSALDLACGTGIFIDALLRIHPELNIIGTDASKEMLGVAQKRFSERNNVQFVNMDFCQGLFPDESFDLITMSYGLRSVPKGQEKNFVQNTARWLKKGGRLILVDLQPTRFEKVQEAITHCLWKNDNLEFKRETNLIHSFENHFKLLGTSHLGQERPLARTTAYYFEKL